ncbi:MAG: hypothetical protein M5U34_20530 [Chloroflexi bacterium]|nr:hypothetical protein [Chloroflexota bacterium]
MAAGEVGGEWISPTQFFIRFAEEGPLLLDADQPGQVINVLSALFALAPPAERKGVVAAPGDLPDSFLWRWSVATWIASRFTTLTAACGKLCPIVAPRPRHFRRTINGC